MPFHPRAGKAVQRLIPVVLACLGTASTQAQGQRFDIWKGTDLIGSILVEREVTQDRTLYRMASFSEFDVLWKQQVSSYVSTEYRQGEMAACQANVKVNGTMRDSSHFDRADGPARCYVHPDAHFSHESRVLWTTARMYYEEPVGQHSIFVESILRTCRLLRTGPGTYRLYLPDGKVNNYTYRNGRLEEVHVDRDFLELVFKRDG